MAETTYTPFASEPHAVAVRLIVRRVKPTQAPNWPLSPTTATTPSSPTGGRLPGVGGGPSSPRPGGERHKRPQVRRGTQPHALGTILRQRRLDGRAGDIPQPGPLDFPHRSGCAGDEHKDPQASPLLPGRTTHTLGPPPHPASPAALALGGPGSAGALEHGCAPCQHLPDTLHRPLDPSSVCPIAWPNPVRVNPPCLLPPLALQIRVKTGLRPSQHLINPAPALPFRPLHSPQDLTLPFPRLPSPA